MASKEATMWAVIYDPRLTERPMHVFQTEREAIERATDDPWRPKVRMVRVTEIKPRKKQHGGADGR